MSQFLGTMLMMSKDCNEAARKKWEMYARQEISEEQIEKEKMKNAKKALTLAVLLLAGSFLLFGTASANSWGLTGKLYRAVAQSKSWDDYTTLSNQEGSFAVMHSRYHHALFFVDSEDHLHVYTTAVYQPGTKREAPKLYWDGHYLTVSYGESEYYTFCEWNEGSGEYQLSEAVVNEFKLSGIPGEYGFSWQYQATDDDHDAAVAFPEKITLANFNIDLFPHSVDEVCHLNYMHARFDSGLNVLGTAADSGDAYDPDHPGNFLQPKKKGTSAVYCAPYGKSAWRAGKGKAAVGMNGGMWVLFQYKNENGQSYACIRYSVSERTQRIGYALCRDLGLPEITEQRTEPGRSFVHIDVEATADTFLTDDPDVSQFNQFSVPKGTQFSCLGLYNDSYAYVAAEVRNGKFVDGGAVVWGFVPIRDLKPMEQEKVPDVMENLAGAWQLNAGGSLAPDILVLETDGSFTAPGMIDEVAEEGASSGTWYVTKYNPFMNLYWNETSYELTLLFDNGHAIVRGLELMEEGFSLIFWEGGAGYIPYDGSQDPEGDHG